MTEQQFQYQLNQWLDSTQYKENNETKEKDMDWSLTTEVIGVSLASYGLFLIFPPISFIALGGF